MAWRRGYTRVPKLALGTLKHSGCSGRREGEGDVRRGRRCICCSPTALGGGESFPTPWSMACVRACVRVFVCYSLRRGVVVGR